ncbi:unnamed protein product [Cuscuta epithymum]|uniref:Uncharacterized protein n=1 Tax=Cuscuta epithymum TaxID=186058 RepID=A0AAV0EH45_9ASTE|nr:unnamed protein product [Cuscuta epithymum]
MVRTTNGGQTGNNSRQITLPPPLNTERFWLPRDSRPFNPPPPNNTSSSSGSLSNQPESPNSTSTLSEPNPSPCSHVKKEIVPEGKTGFIPCSANRYVMPCLKKKFDEPILSYTEASPELKNIWLNLFKERYTWRPEHNYRICKNFNSKGSAGLSRALSAVRKSKKRPNWIIKSLWTQLLVKWGDIKYIQKCETNQKNRNSDVGITLHTGGSIPLAEHCRRYEAKHGVSAEPDKMFLQTHTKKEDGSFVTPKAQKVYVSVL